MSAVPLRMLWLEHDIRHREAIRSQLAADRETPFELVHAPSVDAARNLVAEGAIGAAVVCVQSTGRGVSHLMELRDGNDDLPIVIVVDSDRDAAALLACGAHELLVAAELDVRSVLRAVHCAMERVGLAKAGPVAPEPRCGCVRFDTFELDMQRLELRESGAPVNVHPTPMRLLVHLVEHADRVVSKEELLQEVWEGTFVSDFAISSALKELRQVLHDDGVRQRVIKTLRGSGYRFVAPEVEEPVERPREEGALITVLPFDDLSEGRDCADLAQRLQEAVLESLARHDGLRVMSAPPPSGASPLALARDLGVDKTILGSLRTCRGRLRVSVQLIDTHDGAVVWADHFEPAAEEGLGEAELARLIALRVAHALAPQGGAQGDPAGALGAEAAEACLLGHFHHRQGTGKSLERAQREYERAIQLAPACALPYVGLADVLLRLCGHGRLAPQWAGALTREEALPRAIRNVGQALVLDPLLGRAHAVRGAVLGSFEWQWSEAAMALDHALELSPDDPDCLIERAKLTAIMGGVESGVALGREALDRDPLNVPLRLDYARLLRLARRADEALCEQLRVVEMHPESAAAHADLGSSLDLLGRQDEAIEAWLRMLKVGGFPAALRRRLARAHAADGALGYWRGWLEIASDEPLSRQLPAEWLWLPCARLRDFDQAFAWLDRACRARSAGLAYIEVDPLFDELRDDARFAMLAKRVGISA